MLEYLLSAALAPFSLALAILLGLLALELVLGLLGGSLLGAGAEAPGIDAPELDLAELDLAEFDLPDLEAADFDAGGADAGALAPFDGDAAPGPSGAASLLGLGKTPFMIWLASLLLGFGVSGLVVQAGAGALLGGPLPGWLASLPALVGGWAVARGFGGVFARLIPADETQSVSEKHLGRRAGVVTQGMAERGRPAEVRVTDRHGNVHYLRAEPLQDGVRIPQGSRVLVLRDPRQGVYRLFPIE